MFGLEFIAMFKIIKAAQLTLSIHAKIYNLLNARNRIIHKICESDHEKSAENVTWQEFYSEMSAEEITDLTLCVGEILALICTPFDAFVYLPWSFFPDNPDTPGDSPGEKRLSLEKPKEIPSTEDIKIMRCLYLVHIISPILGVPTKIVYATLKNFSYEELMNGGVTQFIMAVIIRGYTFRCRRAEKMEEVD